MTHSFPTRRSSDLLTNGGDGERGKAMPQEVKDKLRKANLGKKISDEQRKKLSESLKGRPISLEHRAALSSFQTKIWSDPNKREKRSEVMTDRKSTRLNSSH